MPVPSWKYGEWSRRTFLLAAILGCTPTIRAADALSLDTLLSFDTLYKSVGVLGTQYSERAKALKGKATTAEAEAFRGQMLTEMAKMSLEDGLVMQIHPESVR